MTPDQQLESRKQYWSPSDDPTWDCRQCRCENNSDYCEYCESFFWDKEDAMEREGQI